MSELARAKNLAPSRRSIIRTAAWTVPAVSIAVAAPAVAATSATSTDPAEVLIENGSAVRSKVGNTQYVQWTIPVALTNADLTGLMADFAGSDFAGQSGQTDSVSVKLVNDLGQSVGTWTSATPHVGYGTAAFNPGGSLPDGPYRIIVTWARQNNSGGWTSATFTWPGGTATVGASEIKTGTVVL